MQAMHITSSRSEPIRASTEPCVHTQPYVKHLLITTSGTALHIILEIITTRHGSDVIFVRNRAPCSSAPSRCAAAPHSASWPGQPSSSWLMSALHAFSCSLHQSESASSRAASFHFLWEAYSMVASNCSPKFFWPAGGLLVSQ